MKPMAQITLGIASSHGPMLSMPPEYWPQRAETDRRNPELYFRGTIHPFDDLIPLRQAENLAEKITPEQMSARFDACQVAMDALGRTIVEADLDIMVVIGDDQEELFYDDNMPAFSIFTGAEFDHVPPTAEQIAKLLPGIASGLAGRYPPVPMKHPGSPDLAAHLVDHLMAADFDVSVSRRLPPGRHDDHSIPHAYGFVYTRLLADKVMPQVPVFVNTFYPPNQPSVARCWAFGQQVAAAVRGFPGDAKVGIVASGGLSHFVVDEELDAAVLDAFRAGGLDALNAMPANLFQSGSSEIKNWIALAGAMSDTTLSLEVVDYVACYRSLAGTGNGMGFAQWR
jgi:Catalytic LigB subunit of aromatic ring-opening dioxygenase